MHKLFLMQMKSSCKPGGIKQFNKKINCGKDDSTHVKNQHKEEHLSYQMP